MVNVGPLFERALRDLAIALPSKEEAVCSLLRHHVGRIAEGLVPPRDGMRSVLNEVYYPADLYTETTKYVGDSHGLQHLLGSFYSYDDLEERPEEVSFEGKFGEEALVGLDRHIVSLAKSWIDQYGR
jgi:hypothetical protein